MIWRKDLILWRFTVVIWVQLWSILCQTGLSCHARKKLKQTNASAHLVQCRFKICGGHPEGIRMTGWKDLWKREREMFGVKGWGSDRWWERRWLMTVMRWYAQDEVNQEESEQNEVNGMKKGADRQTHLSQEQQVPWYLVVDSRTVSIICHEWARHWTVYILTAD